MSDNSMKAFVHDIDCHGRPIEVVPIADLHIGDPAAKINLIRNLVEQVRTNPNRYAILVGDLMNTAIANSKSDFYSELMKPSKQLETCYELLSPIKDKVLGIVSGNHEERISKQVGVDMTQVLATELGLQHLYSDTSALIIIRFTDLHTRKKRSSYSIYVNHGHGGGRRPGGKINGLADFGSLIDADCFIIGHTHLPASFKDQAFHVVPQSGSAVLRERLFVNTASALGYTGYGNRNGYQPASNSYPIITFDNETPHMTVTM